MSELTCVDSRKVNLLLGVFFIAELIDYHIGYGVKVGNVAAEQLAEIYEVSDIKRCNVFKTVFKSLVNLLLNIALGKVGDFCSSTTLDGKISQLRIDRNGS